MDTFKPLNPKENQFKKTHNIYVLKFIATHYRGKEIIKMTKEKKMHNAEYLRKDFTRLPLAPNSILFYDESLALYFNTPFPLVIDTVKDFNNLMGNFHEYCKSIPFLKGHVAWWYSLADQKTIYSNKTKTGFEDIMGIYNRIKPVKEMEKIVDSSLNIVEKKTQIVDPD